MEYENTFWFIYTQHLCIYSIKIKENNYTNIKIIIKITSY